MGTILFIILRLVKLIDTPADLPILCLLVSIDSVGIPALWGLIRKK